MKVFVTGAAGQLGHDVMNELAARGVEGVGSDLSTPCIPLDITDARAVSRVLLAEKPDAVVHCAAWTAVDLAEEEEKRPAVRAVNAVGTENIARACRELGCKMIYISTDYVFDGRGERPWQPDDPRAPLNVYGRTKCEGEEAVERLLEKYFIVRVSWVFGRFGKNFVRTMLDLGKSRKQISVVSDQIGSPTYTADLARLLVDMAGSEAYGRYHATNEGGFISWCDFAREIFRQASAADPAYARVQVKPVSSAEYPARAARPENSRMDKSKLAANGFAPLPPWQDALRRYLAQIGY